VTGCSSPWRHRPFFSSFMFGIVRRNFFSRWFFQFASAATEVRLFLPERLLFRSQTLHSPCVVPAPGKLPASGVCFFFLQTVACHDPHFFFCVMLFVCFLHSRYRVYGVFLFDRLCFWAVSYLPRRTPRISRRCLSQFFAFFSYRAFSPGIGRLFFYPSLFFFLPDPPPLRVPVCYCHPSPPLSSQSLDDLLFPSFFLRAWKTLFFCYFSFFLNRYFFCAPLVVSGPAQTLPLCTFIVLSGSRQPPFFLLPSRPSTDRSRLLSRRGKHGVSSSSPPLAAALSVALAPWI